MNQQELIRRVTAALESDSRVLALFLAGSFGKGSADTYSDVDFLVVTEPEARENFLSSWPRILEEITHVVFWNHGVRGAPLVNAITAEWLRCDVVVVDHSELTKRSQESLTALIDRANLFTLLPPRSKREAPNPLRTSFLIHEFLRVLGLLAVVAGRGEYLVGVTGAGMLRSHLISLLLEENDMSDTGVLHLSQVLSEEQRIGCCVIRR
jgi:predicted nucleotidyltransferase